MLKRFFITGTDTSVGKTVVSRALLQALASGGKSVAGYKPVAKGSKETAEGMRNKDAPLIGELPYLPRAEQRELGQYIRLSMLGSVLAVDRIMA
ncbi:TPA_asm: AAA family ATPase [Salmonella enterica subsp. enterica serovar Mbandaka]|uniref:AAA family ATPase n=1 Tax=Salmonella enterica subsp. enterica serovar Mbandaka TaxID=192954 RepID=A0A6Y5KL03_SALET|nr:AAA family ATPase [Salmonella enterica subsp. enterica serovar Mbandaka]